MNVRHLLPLIALAGWTAAAPAYSQQPPTTPPSPATSASPQTERAPTPQKPPPSTLQPTPPQPSGSTLTLGQAQQLALKQITELTQAEADVRVAEEDVRQAQYGFLPVFSAPLQYIFTSPMHGPTQTGVPFSEREPAFVANNGINEYVLLAEGAGTIDINGKLRATLDKSRADLARSRAVALVARRGLASAVSDAYYGLALAHAKRQLAEETLRSAQEFLGIAQLQFEGGEVAELDVIKSRIDVTARTDELFQARAAEQEAADTFNALAGIGFGTPTIVEELTLAAPAPTDLSGFSVDQIRQRPEFAQLDAEERAADADVRSARADRLPSLTYSVTAGVDDVHINPSRDLGAAAVVSLNVPIFDWGAARSRQQQAEFRREAAKRGRVIAERALLQQYSTARTQSELAAERVRVGAAGLADATRALDVSVARYRAGEAPVIEVVDARKTLSDQRAAYYQAIFDYRVALDRLRQAVGR